MSETEITAGDIRRVPYPFYRGTFDEWDEDGVRPIATWVPGTRLEPMAPDGGDSDCIADGMGFMRLLVVSVHKPGRYPTRVFYVRKWEDPDGRQFGKGALRMTTLGAFRQLLSGYRHPYELVAQSKKEAA